MTTIFQLQEVFQSAVDLVGGQILFPSVIIFSSFILGRILHVPIWLCLLVFAVPQFFPAATLPLNRHFQIDHPSAALLINLSLSLALLLGIAIARFLGNAMSIGSSFFSTLFKFVFLSSLLLLTAVAIDKDMADAFLSGWTGSFALVLFSLSALALAVAMIRFMRAGILFSVWALLCLALASELLLKDIPTEFLSERFQVVRRFVPEDITRTFTGVNNEEAASGDSFKILHVTNYPEPELSGGRHFIGEALEERLNQTSSDVRFSVVESGGQRLSSRQFSEMLDDALILHQPDMVLFGQWLNDSRAGNAYNLPQLDEESATRFVNWRRRLAKIPFIQDVYESRLAAWLFDNYQSAHSDIAGDDPVRVSPAQFRENVTSMVNKVHAANAAPLLYSAPAESKHVAQNSVYIDALREVAATLGAEWIDLAGELARKDEVVDLFSFDKTLSVPGRAACVEALVRAIQKSSVQYARLSDGETVELSNSFPGKLEERLIVPTSTLGNEIMIGLNSPVNASGYYRFVFGVNNTFLDDRRILAGEPVQLRFSIPARYREVPLAELQFRAVPSNPAPWQYLGETNVAFRGTIHAESDPTGESFIRVAGEDIFSSRGQQGWVVVSLDGMLGRPIQTLFVPASNSAAMELTQIIRGFNWGTPVLLMRQGGHAEQKSELSIPSFRYLGIKNPTVDEAAFVALGFAGMPTGKAIQLRGQTKQTLTFGEGEKSAAYLFAMTDLDLNYQAPKTSLHRKDGDVAQLEKAQLPEQADTSLPESKNDNNQVDE